VRILHTGVGADAARVAMEAALCEELPERVIASGFAGALVPELAAGEIVTDATWGFASASEVLTTAEEKRAFREKTGADVVEMETDAIREVCALAGVPVTALRAISDGAEDDLALPPELLEALSRRPVLAAPRLLGTLLTDAARRKSFLRLVRDCRTAQQALARALAAEIEKSS